MPPPRAPTVQEQLIAGHGDHYRLIEWCIMPNHVRVLIGMKPEQALARTVQQWKGASAIAINRLSGRNGTFWMRGYFDRFIRDEDHFLNARIYVRKNPVKAGLCTTPEDWPFSSAGSGWIP